MLVARIKLKVLFPWASWAPGVWAVAPSSGAAPHPHSTCQQGPNLHAHPATSQEADPSGTHYVWKANAIGQDAKSVCEILEKNYTDESIEVEDLTIKLVMKALLEVV